VGTLAYGLVAAQVMLGPKHPYRPPSDLRLWTRAQYVGLPSIPIALVASRLPGLEWMVPSIPVLAFLLAHPNGTGGLGPDSPWGPMMALPFFRFVYAMVRPVEAFLNLMSVGSRNSESSGRQDAQPSQRSHLGNSGRQLLGVMRGRRSARLAGRASQHNPWREALGALVLPFIGRLFGDFLARLPVRSWLPKDSFYRNLLGGAVAVVANDVCVAAAERLRETRRHSRRVGEGGAPAGIGQPDDADD
jgi:hypothetical protein